MKSSVFAFSIAATFADPIAPVPPHQFARDTLQALFDSLEGGETLEEFLEGFPTVTREMAIAVLEQARELLCGALVTRL